MSSHSPRGSLSGASTSAEVAADFEESLKDLQNNNRYEISNLTVIAKENTEHAQAISRALENHIKTVRTSCNIDLTDKSSFPWIIQLIHPTDFTKPQTPRLVCTR
jgi:pre-mRNA cleavage complex 2 protein Pcf11